MFANKSVSGILHIALTTTLHLLSHLHQLNHFKYGTSTPMSTETRPSKSITNFVLKKEICTKKGDM